MKKTTFYDYKSLFQDQNLVEFSENREALLWLKIKSFARKDLLERFLKISQLDVKSTSVAGRFEEIFELLSKECEVSHRLVDAFVDQQNSQQLEEFDSESLVSELYKLREFDWGGGYKNSLDKYLVSRYVKVERNFDVLADKLSNEVAGAVRGYLFNSWYNHWSSILIENIFKGSPHVLATVGQTKSVDFFLRDVPFDLKVTYFPEEYVKEARKSLGLDVELTLLKRKARASGVVFDKNAKPSDIFYEITEKFKDSGDQELMDVLEQLKQDRLSILDDAMNHPKVLEKWLYENQGEMRFGSENRLFLILIDKDDFRSSWKLKRNFNLMKPIIEHYLENFQDKQIDDLKINFEFKGKSGIYNTMSDTIFVVK